MKILLFEWLTGGGLLLDGQPLAASSSLFREGAAMASALAEDWTAAGHEVTVLLDHRGPEFVPAHQVIRVSGAAAWEKALVGLAAVADRIMVIAPETGQRLERTLALLEPYRARLLCPSGEAVVVGSSKHRTALRLEAAGVQRPFGRLLLPGEQPLLFEPVGKPPGSDANLCSRRIDLGSDPFSSRFPDRLVSEFASLANGECLVLKPDDGSGSEGVRLIDRDQFSPEQSVPDLLPGKDQRDNKRREAANREKETLPSPPAGTGFGDSGGRGAGGEVRGRAGAVADASGSSGRWPGEGGDRFRLERFLSGYAVSICLVAGPAGVWFLPPTRQRFKTDLEPIREPPGSDAKLRSLRSHLGSDPLSSPDRLLSAFDSSTAEPDWPGAWCGFDWPLVPELAERALGLARRSIAALPAFTGPAGLDMVLSDSDPAEDRVVDFNPRLTSSWVGLRQLFHANLGAHLLAMVDGAPPPELTPVRELLEWRL